MWRVWRGVETGLVWWKAMSTAHDFKSLVQTNLTEGLNKNLSNEIKIPIRLIPSKPNQTPCSGSITQDIPRPFWQLGLYRGTLEFINHTMFLSGAGEQFWSSLIWPRETPTPFDKWVRIGVSRVDQTIPCYCYGLVYNFGLVWFDLGRYRRLPRSNQTRKKLYTIP